MSTLAIRLPDGTRLSVPSGATVLGVAEQIGAGLARAAVAGRIDGRLVDLRTPLEQDVSLEIVTLRDAAAGEVIRHSAEHVMADAVRRLFPTVQIDVGRSDHSEKYQYDFKTERPFTPDDLARIEKEMRRIVSEKARFEREEVDRETARALFAGMDEELKLSRLDDIPEGEPITVFRHGEFVDLCRGPHVQHAGQIGAFKILEVAGAYWRGDESNPMLQRIYGTAFATKRELEEHLARIEEAKRRDHRRIGAELGLFHIDPLSPGSPFYLPKGMVLYNGLVDYIKSLYPKYGYQEVMAPQLFRAELFQVSGHYDKFHDDMFWFEGADEGEELGIKGMNCPGHCRIFSLGKRSYRELPLRLAEFSRLHRNERSGTLTGLARVRAMAQDDAHIFCTPDQIQGEVDRFFQMVTEVYQALGLPSFEIFLETRPEEFIGDPSDWEAAERMLLEAVRRAGYECGIKPGEAAFYGPKVACDFSDVLGRSWTLATLQLDVGMPSRFGLRYIGDDGQEHQPAMLHRAVLGSLERFLAIYIEHTAGDFPLWLAPVQVAILPITERHLDYGRKVRGALAEVGVRAELDERNEKLGFKIREAELQKIPVMAVVGDEEASRGTVTPRRRGRDRKDGEAMGLEAFADSLAEEIQRRGR